MEIFNVERETKFFQLWQIKTETVGMKLKPMLS